MFVSCCRNHDQCLDECSCLSYLLLNYMFECIVFRFWLLPMAPLRWTDRDSMIMIFFAIFTSSYYTYSWVCYWSIYATVHLFPVWISAQHKSLSISVILGNNWLLIWFLSGILNFVTTELRTSPDVWTVYKCCIFLFNDNLI